MQEFDISQGAAQYLQTIYMLSQKNLSVRQVDVSRHIGIEPSSYFSDILELMHKAPVEENAKKLLSLSESANAYAKRL